MLVQTTLNLEKLIQTTLSVRLKPYPLPRLMVAQVVNYLLQCKRPGFDPWVRKIPWRRARLPTPVFLDFPCGSAGKEFACNVGDLGLVLELGRSPGEGKDYPLQYSGLENSMDYIVQGSQRVRHD